MQVDFGGSLPEAVQAEPMEPLEEAVRNKGAKGSDGVELAWC